VERSRSRPLDVVERRRLLEQALRYAAASGTRIESQGDTFAVLVRGEPVNHLLHLVLTLATGGLWLIVWLVVAATGGEKRFVVTVDESGALSTTRARAA
jgi:hypothetical protein